MSKQATTTVRTKQDPRGPTWAVDKAGRMHAKNAARADKGKEKSEERRTARAERRAARRQAA